MTADLATVRWAVVGFHPKKGGLAVVRFGANRRADMALLATTIGAGEILVELAAEATAYPPDLVFDPETQTLSNP